MKRLFTILLTLALLMGLSVPATAESAFLSWNGVELQALAVNADESDGAPHLTLHVRIVNGLDRKLWIGCDETTIDGVPVSHPGLNIEPNSDTGTAHPQHYRFEGDNDAAYAAIRDAHTLEMHVLIEDYDTFESLYDEWVSIDLSALSKGKEPAPTPKPTISPGKYTSTSPSSYRELTKGSKGEDVKALQQRLIDLGYLNDKADGSYGNKTAGAVRSFCYQNMDVISGDASPEMQARLFSSNAKAYEEPWIPLLIGEQCKWDPVKSVNTFFFKVQVTNTSKTRTIKGFELNLYYTNLWGEKLDQGVTYTQSMSIMVRPGETKWSNSFNLGNWYSVDTVWVGISRIVFDDGEIREFDDVLYFPCYISKN